MYTNFYQSSEGGTVSHVDLVPERFTPAQVKVVVELELLCLVKKKDHLKNICGRKRLLFFMHISFTAKHFPDASDR